MKRGASLTLQFHRWRGIGFDPRKDLFLTWSLNLGWISFLGYGGVLDEKLRDLHEILTWARKEQERDGR